MNQFTVLESRNRLSTSSIGAERLTFQTTGRQCSAMAQVCLAPPRWSVTVALLVPWKAKNVVEKR